MECHGNVMEFQSEIFVGTLAGKMEKTIPCQGNTWNLKMLPTYRENTWNNILAHREIFF